MKFLLVFSLTFCGLFASINMSDHIVGGVTYASDQAEHDRILGILHENVNLLEAGDWEVIEITKVGHQVVGGMKYFFVGKFKNKSDGSSYTGTVTVWTRPWENFVKAEFVEKQKVQ